MLTALTEWSALSKRISGLLKAGEFYFHCHPPGSSDPYGIAKRELLPNSQQVFNLLSSFAERHQATLPTQAASSMEQFIERSHVHFSVDAANHDTPELATQLRLTALASFQAEFDFHLSDFEATTRRLSERAFSHLQRCIVADPVVGERWRNAYHGDRGEEACEKLGAAHLLGHGIWAFKGHAPGERTDLIMGDHLTDLTEAQRSAEALVLTEWKLVSNPNLLPERVKNAYAQAARYAGGSLAGFELAGYRYLVLVSEDFMEMPPSRLDKDVEYRFINIAVNPRTPSRGGGVGERRTTPASTGQPASPSAR